MTRASHNATATATANANGGRTLVLLCDCHGTLRSRLDFEALTRAAQDRPEVAAVYCCSALCETGAAGAVADTLATADRVVLAGCGRAGEQPSIGISGCGPAAGLTATANIRELCAFPLPDRKEATARANALVAAALRRVGEQTALPAVQEALCRDVLVLGGGAAAARAALHLAELDHEVTLVFRGRTLASDAATQFAALLETCAASLADSSSRVEKDAVRICAAVADEPRIHCRPESTVANCRGQAGDFTVMIDGPDGPRKARAGAILVALTDFASLPVRGADTGTGVLDLAALAARLQDGTQLPRRLAFLLDHAAEQGRLSSTIVLAAARAAAVGGSSRVRVYCRNVRVAGPGLEQLYRAARAAGVEFVRYAAAPSVTVAPDGVRVVCEDTQIGRVLDDCYDWVVNADLAPVSLAEPLFGTALRAGASVPIRSDSIWLRPWRTSRPGIFLVGGGGSDSLFRDVAEEREAAVRMIHEFLQEPVCQTCEDAAVVDPEKCVACLTCVRLCPHEAIAFDPETEAARVAGLACQRCGICAAECPAGAIQLPRFADAQIRAETASPARLTVFACENSGAAAVLGAGRAGCEQVGRIQLVSVPCAGKVDPRHLLKALERGAERVLVLGCHPEGCQYLDGATRAQKRIERVRSILESAGVDPARVLWNSVIAGEAARCAAIIEAAAAGTLESPPAPAGRT